MVNITQRGRRKHWQCIYSFFIQHILLSNVCCDSVQCVHSLHTAIPHHKSFTAVPPELGKATLVMRTDLLIESHFVHLIPIRKDDNKPRVKHPLAPTADRVAHAAQYYGELEITIKY